MSEYIPPLDDIRFVLRRLAGIDDLAALDAFRDAGLDSLDDVLAEAGRFASEVVAPTNRIGDVEGCRIIGGSVQTPTGFAKAWQLYVGAGWAATPFPPEYGGGGLPWLVATAIQEMMTAANTAWALCPMLTHGAIHLLDEHGDEIQRETWLPRLVSGEWTGTMNLTEPQAGSDVGAVATKAVRQLDGSYRITGQKIFITYGDHDMAENIVHLTLARVPDAPVGTRGISCFIVPKFLVDESGAPSRRNSISVVSIEHKMGINGSPTCVLAFDEAEGYLIGDENAGMKYMFTMMNNARLSVGVEGLGLADRATQQAFAFARDRRQGRARGSKEPSPIIAHPDVQRMLITMRALTEASRGICYLTALATDIAERAADPAVAAAAQERADLLTPIAKAWSTDIGNEVANLGIQVHGGYGFIEETGAAQHARDARITTIYEGTNGIQAIDLVARKLTMRDGGCFEDLLAEIDATVAAARRAGLASESDALAAAATTLRSTGQWLLSHRDDALAGATPFLRLMGLTLGGWVFLRSMLELDDVDPKFADRKRTTAVFYLTQLLPQVAGLAPAVTAGAAALAGVD